MALTDQQIIDYGIQLFEDERHWTKGTRAKNAQGKIVDVKRAEDVTAVCLTGLCDRLSTDASQSTRVRTLIKRFLPNNYHSVESFNDSAKTTIDDVRHVLRSVKLHFKHTH